MSVLCSSRKSKTMDSDSEDQYGEDDTDHNDHRIGMDGDEPLTTSTPLYSHGKKKKKRPGLWKRFKHKTKPMRKISTQVMEKAHHKSHGHSDDENISSARSRSFVSKSEPQLHHDSKNYNSLPRSHRFGGSVIDRTKLFVETDGRQTYSSDSDTGARTNGTGIVRRSSSSSSRKILSFDVNSESRHSKSLPTDGELDMDVPQLAASPAAVRKRLMDKKHGDQSSSAPESSPHRTTSLPLTNQNNNQQHTSGGSEDDYHGRRSRGSSLGAVTMETNQRGSGDDAMVGVDGGFLSTQGMSLEEMDERVAARFSGVPQPGHFYRLEVHLKEGRDLAVRDWSGSSDPYIRFKINGKQVYKSKTIVHNLNPRWNEVFSVAIEDVTKHLHIHVFDYDIGTSDDPMGNAKFDLMTLKTGEPTEAKLDLSDDTTDEYLGYIVLVFSLIPVNEGEYAAFNLRLRRDNEMRSGSQRKGKSQTWIGVVTITLLEGRNMVPMDDNGLSDPYVKFKLGGEKWKSRVESKTLNPKWMEQFDLRMYEEQSSMLEISVWDKDLGSKDDIMGRSHIDLSTLDMEQTHQMTIELEDNAGTLDILLTISGTVGTENVSDLANYKHDPNLKRELCLKYGLLNSFKDIKDVGWLQVKVIKAQNLQAADIGGKSDPFCVLELVNARLQTQTVYKTLHPEWGKVFTLQIKDIHSVLEVTVYDEDKHGSPEFLGKVAIPILKVKCGERRPYTLKDKKLKRRAKGTILLELDFIYNDVKAAIRTFNPRENKYMEQEQRFKISVLQNNLSRVSNMVTDIVSVGRFINSCFQWESKLRTIIAFAAFLIIVWNFQLYMAPLAILMLFTWKFVEQWIVSSYTKPPDEDDYEDSSGEEDEAEEKDKKKEKKTESKRSFKEKLQAIERVCQTIQNTLDQVACLGERVKNTFNFTVPWLSYLAIIVLCIVTIVLYFIPLRYLILAWGINKFTKKIRKPHAIPNNELLDFLSRLPSDTQLKQYRELRPELSRTDSPKKKK
ncbi:multiple C2 and transmembrane domain-containing protein 1-like isoform X3 [Lytechinus variegatus]|uniref:multiple C2 and transmembrane domain-containing protein 1-like isoform X3 n=1 Tax=Lytechinus variegatus TaxID=7654 RepID=UPI001BB144C4|nr:multiple C2 and transmembrane domain-containing protein 1-like isoform X3 [Lytechinus variegatus]